MEGKFLKPSKVFFGRLAKGDDLLAAIEAWCRAEAVSAGLVSVIGALSAAVVSFYDQETKSYRSLTYDRHLELLAGIGNISLKDGRPFCHLHLTLADDSGRAFGGHLMPGCVVFAGEVHIICLDGEPPERHPDAATGLALWRF